MSKRIVSVSSLLSMILFALAPSAKAITYEEIKAYQLAQLNYSQEGQGQVLGASTVPINGLVGYWNFDESSGTVAADGSGNYNFATMTNGGWGLGKINNAAAFNGTNGYVTIPQSSNLNMANTLSIAFWMKYTGIGTNNGYSLVEKKGWYGNTYGYSLSLGAYWTPGRIGLWSSDSSEHDFPCVSDWSTEGYNQWVHVAAVFDGATATVYCNGVSKGSAAIAPVQANTRNIALGMNSDFPNSSYFPGLMDEMMIYNRALTASEVAAIYSSTSGPVVPVTPPIVSSFTAKPNIVGIGGSSVLSWIAPGATSVNINPGDLSSANNNGSITVSPTANTTYTLTAVNGAGSATSKTSVTVGSFPAVSLDQYGGVMSLKSPGGITGRWAIEKYPVSGGGYHWMITTPDGHGMMCMSQYAVTPPFNLNMSAKYGNISNWAVATIDRYRAMGFNCLGDYANPIVQAPNMDSSHQMPFFVMDHYAHDAMWRREMFSGQVLPPEQVKSLMSVTGPMYTNWRADVPDSFDPNFAPYSDGYTQAGNSTLSSPWVVGMVAEDADYTFGFGPGPDDSASADGVYHPHIGWLALAAAPNEYAAWNDSSNPYSASNWFFTDTVVHAKANLVSFLQSRYNNSIAALNTAWGSNYTQWGSTGTRTTGEAVGTTNNAVTQLTHTIAVNPTHVSPGSIVVKVDGAPMATVPAYNNTLTGRWPDGVTKLGGSFDPATGLLTIKPANSSSVSPSTPGGISWGNINLGVGNIIPGSVMIRQYPNDCRISDDGGTNNTWQKYPGLCAADVTPVVTGVIDYAAGTITNLTISPAISAGKTITIFFDYKIPLPGNHTVTVDYDTNGYGMGTGLLDEDGRHTAWLGSRDGVLPKAGNAAGYTQVATAGAKQDLDDWLYNYTSAYYTVTNDRIKLKYPNMLFQGSVGGHGGVGRKPITQAVADHNDIISSSQITQKALDLFVSWGIDKPIMSWEGFTANADSYFHDYNSAAGPTNFLTQEERGQAMAAQIKFLDSGRGAGSLVYPMVGVKFWAHSDEPQTELTDWGLITPLDNAYDGYEATTGIHPCSAPLQNYTCGGEAANYGDSVSAVAAANAYWYNFAGPSTPPASDTFAPTVPSGVTATAVSVSRVNLSWAASTDNVAVTGYNVYRNGTKIGATAANSYSDAAVAANTAYTYTVSAFDGAGNSSAQSAPVAVTTPAPIDTAAPVLGSISVAGIATSSATVSWTTNEPATSFVDYGLSTSYGQSAGNSTLTISHTVNLTGLSSAATYHFRVKSADNAGNLATSLDNSFTTAVDPTLNTAPAAITNLAATQPTKTSITLKWAAPGSNGNSGAASSYDIRYGTTPITDTNWSAATAVTGEPVPALAGTNQKYTLVGLQSGTTYYVAIKTVNSQSLTSALSNVVKFTTKTKGK